MLFSELLNPNSRCHKYAFLLGMIYEWPIFLNNYTNILAYSAYKVGTGSRVSKHISSNLEDFYLEKHLTKFRRFIGTNECIFFNNYIKANNSICDGFEIGDGVSMIIDFDVRKPDNISYNNFLLGIIEKRLIDADEEFIKTFFIGAMDSRGSLDFSGKYLTIDLAPRDFPEIAKRKLLKFNDIMGVVFNYNPRLTQENSNQKNDQFRVKLEYFMGNYGLFTPYKIDYYKYEKGYKVGNYDDLFFFDNEYKGTEITSFNAYRNIQINELAIKLKQQGLSPEDKKNIVDQYRSENLIDDNDDEILHSSQNVKEIAKIRDNYKCEFNHEHITFDSKSNGKNYVEAHHLIPFSERNNYELSIDIVENIVCLCPNCHREIHLAVDEQKKLLLNPLFDKKVSQLKNAGINLDKETLYKYYKISN